ncbi:uncharacterized protein LY89DRAFT_497003 [Mollisia scopiformis]|uniref:DUF8004 domain-containing protein n=1 Tax=Mollisia scopiformis TaxID=149040 RepID=A0A194XE66_MOLSC|nr:uncharacterized protein LY89DRAFT_497003 [Mollisia scopiformis]KUJ18473.1 hypothetical protein LY89DRAFT_497003 [Mollisia scopiformis]
MDHALPSLPLKRETSPHEHRQDAFSQPPPTRAPPPLPFGDASGGEWEQNDVAKHANQAWQNGPPSRIAPVPQENFLPSHAASHDVRDSGYDEESLSETHTRRASGIIQAPYAEIHNRSVSRQNSPAPYPQLPQTYTPPPRTDSASPRTLNYRRPRAESLAPPQSQVDLNTNRSVSTPFNSRPNSTVYHSDGEGMDALKDIRRKSSSFITGLFHTPTPSDDGNHVGLRAWVLGGPGGERHVSYNLDFLMKADKIPEMWGPRDSADLYVYFYPRATGLGPQIKCESKIIKNSQVLLALAQPEGSRGRGRARSFDGRGSLTIEDATRNLAVRHPSSPPFTPQIGTQDTQSASDGSETSLRSVPSVSSPSAPSAPSAPSEATEPTEYHLYLPLGVMDPPDRFDTKQNESVKEKFERQKSEQKLIDARNLFAFLNGQVIVATRKTSSAFRCFMAIAELLRSFAFTDAEGESFGAEVNVAFDFSLAEYRFADVRDSRETTLEGLILGEAMKSHRLYNEAYAHAVGKLDTLKESKSQLWEELSPKTREWIERGYIDLRRNKAYVEERLDDFDFPSVFSGMANSTSSDASKIVRFKYWKANFMALRKTIQSYYKALHGSWPPKGKSKKNTFVEGGLNRLVLKGLYLDLCSLWDLLVDRENATTRAVGGDVEAKEYEHPTIPILRKLLDEFDRSTTPRFPPIPFDVPHLPDLATVDVKFNKLNTGEQERSVNKRKLQAWEAALVLEKGHDRTEGASKYNTPFMEMYRTFETKEAKGKTTRELQEQRIGHWIFLYCVLQVLPLLISDATDLSFTDGVEYFLPATPEFAPWSRNGNQHQKPVQYVTATGDIVYATDRQVRNGDNAIYERTHCWHQARRFADVLEQESNNQITPADQMSPLSPPPTFNADGQMQGGNSGASGFLGVGDAGRNGSRTRLSERNSVLLGLEQMARYEPENLAVGNTSSAATRTPPERDVTFDDILAGMDLGGKKDKKKGRK